MQRRGIITLDPLKSVGHRQGECGVEASASWGLWPWSHRELAVEQGLKDRMAGLNWGWSRIWHGPGRRNAFLSILIPLIAPCCSQPSPIRTGSLCLITKLTSSPPPLCPCCMAPCPHTVKTTPGTMLDD